MSGIKSRPLFSIIEDTSQTSPSPNAMERIKIIAVIMICNYLGKFWVDKVTHDEMCQSMR